MNTDKNIPQTEPLTQCPKCDKWITSNWLITLSSMPKGKGLCPYCMRSIDRASVIDTTKSQQTTTDELEDSNPQSILGDIVIWLALVLAAASLALHAFGY